MKKIIPLVFASFFLFHSVYTQPQNPGAANTAGKIHLLSPYFLFKTASSPNGVLIKESKGSFFAGKNREEGFTIKLSVNLREFNQQQTLLEIPGIVSINLKQADPSNRDRQNYPAYTMSDGSVPVLEASIMLTAPVEKVFKRELIIGFPIAALKNPWGRHELILNFTGVRWTIYIDSQIMDNDFAIGYPQFGEKASWQVDTTYIDQASIFFPAVVSERDRSKKNDLTPDVQYWTPQGHNAWVGDVATLYHNGRYHVFYLFDRRHHASKLGVGGHYFEHFSTADFKTWTEHEAAVPIDEQWETFGTGTPFVFNNKLCISYGLHTSRIYPIEMTTSPILKSYYEKHGKIKPFPFDFSKGYPSGSTYSVSDNEGDNFKKSKMLFHYSENPSVYIDPEGKLKMIANLRAKGIWESESMDSTWYCINPDFPPGGDCTFYFRWGKFDYIIGGFVGLWSKPVKTGNEGWVDMVKEGLDFYNGINVPSVTKINDNRFLMAGWFPIRNGWGGPFVVHELIQFPDGRIRTKWMKELVPDTRDTVVLARRTDKAVSFPVKNKSFILSFDVHPTKKKSGKLAVSFLSADKDGYENACEFQINTKELTAQYSFATKDVFAVPVQSLRQGALPQRVGNYAIENLTGTDKPFSVRILVKNTPKLGGSVLDSEIAGQNTMISYRQDLTVENLLFNLQDVDVRNIKIMKIED